MAGRGPWPLMLRTCWVLGRRMTRLSGALVFQVIGQQISVIAATAIFARLTGHFGGRVPDAGEVAAVSQETLHGLGLSRRKAATVLDLAQRFSDGRLSEAKLSELPDQEVIGQLTAVRGIGAWAAQGALLIALRRPMSSARTTWACATRSRSAAAWTASWTGPRWRTWPSAGGRTGAWPLACCWPPPDRADLVRIKTG